MNESVFGAGLEQLDAAMFCKRWLTLIDAASTDAVHALRELQHDPGVADTWRAFAGRTVAAADADSKPVAERYQSMLTDLAESNLLPPYAISMFQVTGYERDALKALFAVFGFERTLTGYSEMSS